MTHPGPDRSAVTMRDVAERAGVSIKTVSNVLNGYPYIRDATRERVLAAIADLGYLLNISARNLRSGRTGMIGFALPELRVPYFAELADEVIHAASELDLTVLIEQTGASKESELALLAGSRRHLTDGLIFSPAALALGLDPGDADRVKLDFPLVVLGERFFDGPVDHVTMPNVEAARTATEHLLARGRRRIAVIGAHAGEVHGAAGSRLAGYTAALRAAGIPLDPALVREVGPWHRANGAAVMGRLLDDGVVLDAVFAFNDTLALGALHELQVRGLRVPQDVAVIGFDDIDEAQYSNPTLTSVDPRRGEIASTAVHQLARRIAGEPAREPVEVACRITTRESTGEVSAP